MLIKYCLLFPDFMQLLTFDDVATTIYQPDVDYVFRG